MDLSSSLSSVSLIESNYNLALKFFMNKNFSKSFEILNSQYSIIFNNFQSGVISETIFVKILNLYLTEVGLLLQSKHSHEFKLSKKEKQTILSQLSQEIFLCNLIDVYEDLNQVPGEILYNLCLINYIGLELNDACDKITKIYGKLEISNDKFFKKIVELLALKVLPELERYDDALQLINESPSIEEKVPYISKVNEIQQAKKLEQDHEEKIKQKLIREQHQREQKLNQEKDLKYRSLKQIKQQQVPEESSIKKTSPPADYNDLKAKLLYNLNFSKQWLTDNSPMVLLVILAFFVGKRIFKSRKTNILENLKETLKMAFKISYL